MENDTIRGFIYLVVATLTTVAIALVTAVSLTHRQEVVDEEAVNQRGRLGTALGAGDQFLGHSRRQGAGAVLG